MRINSSRWLTIVIVPTLIMSPPIVIAQLDDDLVLEEVTVTAQRREQNLRDVPVSVSVITDDAIQNANITRVEDLVALAPSVTFDTKRDFGTSSLRIRGVGTMVLDSGVEPSVATAVDGVILSQGGSALNEFPDIERIEILNGPQGTLFGKNASAGLINIVTKQPNVETFEGFFDIRYAEDQDYKFGFGVSAPLSDTVAYRVSGYWRTYDGNILNLGTKNNVNGIDAKGFRGKYQWTPSDSFSALLSVDYSDQNTGCCMRVLRQDTGRLYYDSSLLNSQRYSGPVLVGSLTDITGLNVHSENSQVNVDREPRNISENSGVSLEATWKVGEHTLVGLTGLRRWETLGTRDNDETPLPLNVTQVAHKESAWFSQELRLESPVGGSYDYLLGLYYYTANNKNYETFDRIISVSLNPMFSPTYGGHFVQSGFARGDIEVANFAVFGNANYYLSDRFSMFAGLRALQDEIDGTISGTRVDMDPRDGIPSDNDANSALIDVGPLSNSASDSDIIGRVGLQYEVSSDAMLYISYSTGFKGRGYSTEYFASNDRFFSEPVKPETSKSVEIGLRSYLLNDKLRLNATAFRTQIEGFQLTFRDLITLINSLNSVDSILTQGVEIDYFWVPTSNWVFGGGLAFTDATYENFPNSNNGDLSGLNLPNAPEFKGQMSVRYQAGLTQTWNWFTQLYYRYQSKVNFLQDGSGFSRFADMGSFGIADLSLGFESIDGRYSVNLFVKNAADEFYVTGISPNGNAGGGFVLHALPRDFRRYVGASLRVSF